MKYSRAETSMQSAKNHINHTGSSRTVWRGAAQSKCKSSVHQISETEKWEDTKDDTGRSESWYIIIFVLIIIILIVVLLFFLCIFYFLLIRSSSFFFFLANCLSGSVASISSYPLRTAFSLLCTNLLCRNISIFLLIRSFISIRSFFRMTLLDRFLCGRLFLPWRLCGKRFFCRSRSDFLFDWSFFRFLGNFSSFIITDRSWSLRTYRFSFCVCQSASFRRFCSGFLFGFLLLFSASEPAADLLTGGFWQPGFLLLHPSWITDDSAGLTATLLSALSTGFASACSASFFAAIFLARCLSRFTASYSHGRLHIRWRSDLRIPLCRLVFSYAQVLYHMMDTSY